MYCGKNPCECTDEDIGQEMDLKDKETDIEGVLVAGALLGGKNDE